MAVKKFSALAIFAIAAFSAFSMVVSTSTVFRKYLEKFYSLFPLLNITLSPATINSFGSPDPGVLFSAYSI